MEIIQVAYDIPNEFSGLLTGELTRFGSVVRNDNEIIGHLKEVTIPDKDYNILSVIKKIKLLLLVWV